MKYKITVKFETNRFNSKTTFIGSIFDVEKVIKEECKLLGEDNFKIKRIKIKSIKH